MVLIFGKMALLKCSTHLVPVKIIGKVKDRDVYLCKITDYLYDNINKEARELFGMPVRHIELEWGNYCGDKEFFVPEKFLSER